MVCYAESDDGINWTKPKLGQKLFRGSRDNNAIDLPGTLIYGATVLKDEDDPDPQRRYKMVCTWSQKSGKVADWAGQPVSTMRTATSPDGIHWTASPDWPLDVFFEHSSFYKHNGLYVAHAQGVFYGGGEGGSDHGRQGFVWVSTDFDHWLQGWAEGFTLPEPQDRFKRGYGGQYDQVHIGVGAANFGNVQVGLFGLWHQEGAPPMHEGTSCDFGLLLSNDGIHFREPVKGHVYISRHESPATQPEGREYNTILCQYNGILNVGDETRIYHGRWRNAGVSEDYYAEVALATLPRDRWGALGLYPSEAEGWVWTAPVVLPEGGSPAEPQCRSRPTDSSGGLGRALQPPAGVLRCPQRSRIRGRPTGLRRYVARCGPSHPTRKVHQVQGERTARRGPGAPPVRLIRSAPLASCRGVYHGITDTAVT